MEQIGTLKDLLAWLSGAGALVLVSWFASWALEGWSAWQQLESRVKSVVILGLAVVIGGAATWASGLPAETLAAVEVYAKPVLLIIGAWLATQVAHRVNNLRVTSAPAVIGPEDCE